MAPYLYTLDLPYYQYLEPVEDICYNQQTYIDTSLSPRVCSLH